MGVNAFLVEARRRAFLFVVSLGIVASAACAGGSGDVGDSRGGSSSAPKDDLGRASPAITPIYGVDYSWYRPAPSSLVADGYRFVARYLSNDTTGKNLSLGEAQALEAAGLDIVSNWEDGAENALDGYNQGVTDAQTAQSQATADGAPATRPIYFSIDFDAESAQAAAVDAYFQGVASVIGLARTGAYGGYFIINQLFNAGLITWGWQTYAWSGTPTQWDPRAQFRQIENGIAGSEMDLDEAVATDFGQWGPGVAPPPPACTNQCTDWPRVGIAAAPTGEGYWIVDGGGHVYPNGNAQFFGDLSGVSLNKPVVGIAATPAGQGYWVVAADGGVFSFGNAAFYGSTGGVVLNKPVVGMAATPDGAGYWLVAADGGIFSYGSAQFYGSMGSQTLNKPVVGMAATPTGKGYWLVAADGGIFSFGDAVFQGSTGSQTLNAPVVGMAATATGQGYWLVAADGGVFTFGNAFFYGSAGSVALAQPMVGLAATPGDGGYWLVGGDGGIFTYGDAAYEGNGLGESCSGNVPQQCILGSSGCYVLQAAAACAAGDVCDHGTCQATCTDACTSGTSRCSGANLELCGHFGSVPCNTWGAATACPTGQSCTGDVCSSPACTDACEPGAIECQGGSLLTCTSETDGGCHAWSAPNACQPGQTCAASGCVTVALPDGGEDEGGSVALGEDGGIVGVAGEDGGVIETGGEDAGDGGTASRVSTAAASCKCSAVGRAGGPSSGAWGLFAVAGLALGARRRRR
jgi:MYXO-CTERM domain-containing protein